MTEPGKRVVLDDLPRVSQKLKLSCVACGHLGVYDVGTIFFDQDGEGDDAKHHIAFTNYFRCLRCNSAGPWNVQDYLKLMGWTLRSMINKIPEGFVQGQCRLFDGTLIQSPAMGEEHLLKLLEKDPRNAFLCTRLGNLFRGCDQMAKATKWYEKSIERDPGDIEARYHLFSFAAEAEDIPSSLAHALLLVRSFLDGRRTEKDELTEGIAFFVVDLLRKSPDQFREHVRNASAQWSGHPEEVFIRTLLDQVGDEEEITMDAAECLLAGEVMSPLDEGVNSSDDYIDSTSDFVPSLRQLIESEGLHPVGLSVAFQTDDRGNFRIGDRNLVPVSDGKKIVFWPVPSMRELFRGNRPPPPDMDRYPQEYCPHFFFIENYVLDVCDIKGDRTDQELEEIFAALRRRPDGRSLGDTHDLFWQVAALMLGSHVLSGAEFEAIFGQLARSTRKWALRPVSRNYVAYLRSTFGR